jgi:hypothetical protein
LLELAKIGRSLDLVFDCRGSGTWVRQTTSVRRPVRIDARGLAVVQIVHKSLVAQDPGSWYVFVGWVHQSGIGRIDMAD